MEHLHVTALHEVQMRFNSTARHGMCRLWGSTVIKAQLGTLGEHFQRTMLIAARFGVDSFCGHMIHTRMNESNYGVTGERRPNIS
jgi:hypothetical protein